MHKATQYIRGGQLFEARSHIENFDELLQAPSTPTHTTTHQNSVCGMGSWAERCLGAGQEIHCLYAPALSGEGAYVRVCEGGFLGARSQEPAGVRG